MTELTYETFNASRFVAICEQATPHDSVITVAISGTSDEMRDEICKYQGAESISEMSDVDAADSLIILTMWWTMKVMDISSDDIRRNLRIPSKYNLFFQGLDKGLRGTPNSDDLKEMFGEN
jgi:hypothetical protein